jgi:hypothetical protein
VESSNGVTSAMKTGATETFLFDEQNLEASASCQNCDVLPAESRSNNNYLIVFTHRFVPQVS